MDAPLDLRTGLLCRKVLKTSMCMYLTVCTKQYLQSVLSGSRHQDDESGLGLVDWPLSLGDLGVDGDGVESSDEVGGSIRVRPDLDADVVGGGVARAGGELDGAGALVRARTPVRVPLDEVLPFPAKQIRLKWM